MIGLPKNRLGVGGGGLEPLFQTPPWGGGLQGPALFCPSFSCTVQIIGFSYHIAKLPCHLLELCVNCRMPLATLEMQAQKAAHPVTMLVPICHVGGEQTAAGGS